MFIILEMLMTLILSIDLLYIKIVNLPDLDVGLNVLRFHEILDDQMMNMDIKTEHLWQLHMLHDWYL
jgi:hypothetical protein